MRFAWLEERDESLGRRLALAPLDLASWIYGAGALAHRRGAAVWRPPRRLAARVVSVGNLVVGGTAKTPLAAWLASQLRRRGRKVVLVSRGYGRSGGAPVEVVSDGCALLASVQTAGDEPLLLAAQARGVPVLVGRDRVRVGHRALAVFDAEVIVLDDGFQHHRLHRDLDLVSFDGRLGLGNRRLLPRGPLREPLSALSRADAIGVVDGPLPEEDEEILRQRAPRAFRFAARRRPSSLRALATGERRALEGLEGCRVGLLAAVAQPKSVRRTLEGLGARVVAERLFRDHHRYRASDLEGLGATATHWVTTEKDALKIAPSWTGSARVDVLGIDLALEDPEPLLDWVESRLR